MSALSAIDLRQSRRAEFRSLVSERAIIVLVRAGRKTARRDHRQLELTPARIGILEAGAPYTVQNHPPEEGAYRASALLVAPETIERLQQEVPARGDAFHTTGDDRAVAAFERATAALSDPLLPERLRENAVREVLLWLAEADIRFGPPQADLVTRLRRLLVQAPDQGWTTAAAAGQLALSEATLRRRLAAEGTSFQDLLADIRMSCALGLLQTGDLPVGRIALEVGYSSPSRFALRFRDRFGLSPSQVRRPQNDRNGTELARIGTTPGP
ncbi:helix-turn-helix transcriptional regulator [Pseudooceanicola sp. CBS1P-1]|uniref:Helix-turn-helix domain-containing protein n=1 Tax=Pseudooceanicola albus TaxID=2692189 RepID=A0A6L7G806_9RHOB|nr:MULTISPECIES: helix-turn-helix transcriptional regulator [Pseudooceanicola]MBT9386315.1 helix-turn-helix transcriptional regulator [Pseudooceanicola endophyticus]MXN20364.1 helix-turn-helix domain-containing protein [Pseudooceanicola albus]